MRPPMVRQLIKYCSQIFFPGRVSRQHGEHLIRSHSASLTTEQLEFAYEKEKVVYQEARDYLENTRARLAELERELQRRRLRLVKGRVND